jgi:hypothetical protein
LTPSSFEISSQTHSREARGGMSEGKRVKSKE